MCNYVCVDSVIVNFSVCLFNKCLVSACGCLVSLLCVCELSMLSVCVISVLLMCA